MHTHRLLSHAVCPLSPQAGAALLQRQRPVLPGAEPVLRAAAPLPGVAQRDPAARGRAGLHGTLSACGGVPPVHRRVPQHLPQPAAGPPPKVSGQPLAGGRTPLPVSHHVFFLHWFASEPLSRLVGHLLESAGPAKCLGDPGEAASSPASRGPLPPSFLGASTSSSRGLALVPVLFAHLSSFPPPPPSVQVPRSNSQAVSRKWPGCLLSCMAIPSLSFPVGGRASGPQPCPRETLPDSRGSWASLASRHVSACGVFPGSIVSFACCLVVSPRLSSIRLIPGGPCCGVPSGSGGCLGPVSPHCGCRASTCRGPTSPLLAFPAICVHCGFRLRLWVQQPPLLTLLRPKCLKSATCPGPWSKNPGSKASWLVYKTQLRGL